MAGRAAEPEVIWARPERTGRGPKPAYTRSDIAAAAVRIADADGIEAVSMRKVAGELGCGTMSLYNYVPRKEDLYELMVDAVSGEYEFSEPSGDWRADMLALAGQTRAIMHRHPWLTRLMSAIYGFSPNVLRYLEHCLGCLHGLDAPPGIKMELIATVNGTVMTSVANELAIAERSRGLPWSAEREQAVRAAYLHREVASGAYPRLAAVLGGGGDPLDPDDVFLRTLTRVLDSFGPHSSAN
ncbi:TetR/AcrR family transcriptional regulator C-terminal domain-containing protein [Streptomyces sp. NBC_01142]|uniref:TetR/AcrR family transcriptional regulator n=1 Tax=Streptomyces sp. NBC_01142 TaxID=2975865 RepID=UPI0022596947|nr:TetR/AcrR family transcriptional regulator C-terminal domain-containing protein [Streptomyces sp. NBC_01142]MCX4822030.1 TetR/AcrR family transcriptional regulator C-terminal domain-containing protein [Streptomyces sp. NBC_01142]